MFVVKTSHNDTHRKKRFSPVCHETAHQPRLQQLRHMDEAASSASLQRWLATRCDAVHGDAQRVGGGDSRSVSFYLFMFMRAKRVVRLLISAAPHHVYRKRPFPAAAPLADATGKRNAAAKRETTRRRRQPRRRQRNDKNNSDRV